MLNELAPIFFARFTQLTHNNAQESHFYGQQIFNVWSRRNLQPFKRIFKETRQLAIQSDKTKQRLMKPAKVQIFSWSTRKVPSLFSKLQSLEQVLELFQVFFLVMDASFNAYHFCTCFWHRFSPPQRLLLFLCIMFLDGRFFSLPGFWGLAQIKRLVLA